MLINKLLENRDIQKIDKSFIKDLTWDNSAKSYIKL